MSGGIDVDLGALDTIAADLEGAASGLEGLAGGVPRGVDAGPMTAVVASMLSQVVTSTANVSTARTGDPEVLGRERILSARGLDDVVRRLREAETQMGSDKPSVRERAMRRYERADAESSAGMDRIRQVMEP